MTFETADFGALAALWKHFYPARYAVDAEMIRRNSVECPVFDWGASQLLNGSGESKGFVLVKKSACPSLYKGDPDQAHISAIAYTDPVVGVDLISATKKMLRNRGVYKLVFGQDSRHFFPGCPDECHALRDFLRVEGFEETSNSFDLECDLTNYEPPSGALDKQEGVEMRPLTDLDKAALDEFFVRVFPGRWRYDTMGKIETEGRADFVMGLFVDGKLEGFALTQDDSHKMPVNGAVWKESLGSNWGTLGPIGVSSEVRGRGLGHGLLAYGLSDLKKREVKNCLIDWTTLDRFYGRHGFTVERKYTGFALRLDV